MRNHFDHLAKDLGQAALGPSGVTIVNDPINAETQYADLRYEPDPARQAARDRLGLLGRIAGDVCLIEVYSQAPSAEEFLMAMQHTWEDARTEGRTAAHAKDVLTVLRARGIAVSDAVQQRILAEREPARLERWLERASVASSIAEVIDDAS